MEHIFNRMRRYTKVLRFLIAITDRENDRLKGLEKFPGATFFPEAFADGNTTLGTNVVLHNRVNIINSTIGRYTYFAEGSYVMNSKIGQFCSIGPDVKIGLGKHPSRVFVSTYPAFFSVNNGGCQTSFVDEQVFQEVEDIEIGNDVWIGARVLITDGIKIGDGAIIAAGAVVTKDVAPYSIVGGVPAKHLKSRFSQDEIDKLMALKWWDKDIEWVKNHSKQFTNISDLLDVLRCQ